MPCCQLICSTQGLHVHDLAHLILKSQLCLQALSDSKRGKKEAWVRETPLQAALVASRIAFTVRACASSSSWHTQPPLASLASYLAKACTHTSPPCQQHAPRPCHSLLHGMQAAVEDALRQGEEARLALQGLRQKWPAAHLAPLCGMARSTLEPALRAKVGSSLRSFGAQRR